jgi:hypothetical protein
VEPWGHVYARNQKKFTVHLVAGQSLKIIVKKNLIEFEKWKKECVVWV